MAYIAKFAQIGKADTPEVGGKGANLGEMAGIGMPVPPGFVVTSQAYKEFLKENKLDRKIIETLDRVNINDPAQLHEASLKIQKLIITAPIPEEISSEIISAYLNLKREVHHQGTKVTRLLAIASTKNLAVAIRSSATSEDSKTASFAGQNETYLNVSGEASVVDYVRRCWASLFEPRSIFYRASQKLDHFHTYIAVVVEAMVQSESSGIMFSIDPVTNNKNRMVIEAIWGLGEYIVQGKVTPDHYEVNKSDLVIVEKRIASQKIMLVRDAAGHTREKSVAKTKQNVQKISDREIETLAGLSKKLEEHYFFPQDSEFAVSQGTVYLVQTRPVTTVKAPRDSEETLQQKIALSKMTEILHGAPASPGIKSGPVKILKSAAEINKVAPGDVLVAPQTNPDYVPAMKKASAIVTDRGGRTSHAAIVSRELGIPAVVGTEKATTVLHDHEIVTVNGSEGLVFLGGLKTPDVSFGTSKNIPEPQKKIALPLKTATKVYVNLGEPEKAKEVAALNCDGVGLLRAEFMLANIGIHPKEALKEGKRQDYITSLSRDLTTFAEAFYPRPIVYRTTDFKTNEYRALKGGDKYEPQEDNPMIGFRGAYRYLVEPEVFQMEIEALKRVREKSGFRNLWLMIPFCRTVSELEQVKDLLHKFGLSRSPSFKLWMMCEIPANVILLDKFIEAGLDGISIGSNDLTMLTLGVDRDNANVASEYNELNSAVMFSFYKVITTCKKYKVTCSMCGQAPSDYPELTEKLVKWGITSVSVNPDVVDKTRQIVYEAEKKLLSST